ncbi:hypothetical protein BpHYR1_001787 [Brachionus plicatilis]|uniref:Uncharacterized protein n=1 Tax=Brachionus plicatilis TaxID=10195 RepID=A0A3M7RLT3_BRAPC|nr:hypothetical protein BpHYR1_001787 [Brachionus plicatilis]
MFTGPYALISLKRNVSDPKFDSEICCAYKKKDKNKSRNEIKNFKGVVRFSTISLNVRILLDFEEKTTINENASLILIGDSQKNLKLCSVYQIR